VAVARHAAVLSFQRMHWTEQDSRVFAEYARFFIPVRDEQTRIICASLDGLPNTMHVLELGCGDGQLALAIAQQFPDATIHGLDGSRHMLERATERLAHVGVRFLATPFELADRSWRTRSHPVHAIVSSLVVHHLDGGEKQQLFRDLFRMLHPDGVLTIADVLRPANEGARRIAAEEWNRSVKQQIDAAKAPKDAYKVFVSEGWNMFEHLDEDPADKPSTLVEHIDWLREAGFRGVDVLWEKAGHFILSAGR
jgi:tRNA (cmo5U34)-methyltransferase